MCVVIKRFIGLLWSDAGAKASASTENTAGPTRFPLTLQSVQTVFFWAPLKGFYTTAPSGTLGLGQAVPVFQPRVSDLKMNVEEARAEAPPTRRCLGLGTLSCG